MYRAFSGYTPSPEETAYDALRTALLDPDRSISHANQPITVHGHLGAGATKSVYDVQLGEDRFALGLPIGTDDAYAMIDKWRVALGEPEITRQLRDIGLPVNPYCEVLPVTINNMDCNAVVLRRYQDLPEEIRDSKNPDTTLHRSVIFTEPTDVGQIIDRLAPMAANIRTLLAHDVHLYTDSFNLRCTPSGELGLYFNDLGNAYRRPFTPQERQTKAQRYAFLGANALRQGLSDTERRHTGSALEVAVGAKDPVVESLVERIIES